MHAAAGLTVKYTWLKAIKKGNFATWPGLTYSNAAKYFPHAVENIKVNMVQYSQGVRSAKKKITNIEATKIPQTKQHQRNNMKRSISYHPSVPRL